MVALLHVHMLKTHFEGMGPKQETYLNLWCIFWKPPNNMFNQFLPNFFTNLLGFWTSFTNFFGAPQRHFTERLTAPWCPPAWLGGYPLSHCRVPRGTGVRAFMKRGWVLFYEHVFLAYKYDSIWCSSMLLYFWFSNPCVRFFNVCNVIILYIMFPASSCLLPALLFGLPKLFEMLTLMAWWT